MGKQKRKKFIEIENILMVAEWEGLVGLGEK